MTVTLTKSVAHVLEATYGPMWGRDLDHVITTDYRDILVDGEYELVGVLEFRLTRDTDCYGYADTVGIANYRVLSDEWAGEPALLDHDHSVISLRLDQPAPADLIDTIKALEDYPVLSDDEHSEVEREVMMEHWDDYGRDEVIAKVAGHLGVDSDQLSDYALELIDWLPFSGVIMGRFGEYPTFMDASYVDFLPHETGEFIAQRLGGKVITPMWRGDRVLNLKRSALVNA